MKLSEQRINQISEKIIDEMNEIVINEFDYLNFNHHSEYLDFINPIFDKVLEKLKINNDDESKLKELKIRYDNLSNDENNDNSNELDFIHYQILKLENH
jgi:hypothetical protein